MAWTVRFLEDVALADLAFETTGESLEDVFRGATQALVESMANPATVPRIRPLPIARSSRIKSVKPLRRSWVSPPSHWGWS
jgi:hypothetical protein